MKIGRQPLGLRKQMKRKGRRALILGREWISAWESDFVRVWLGFGLEEVATRAQSELGQRYASEDDGADRWARQNGVTLSLAIRIHEIWAFPQS